MPGLVRGVARAAVVADTASDPGTDRIASLEALAELRKQGIVTEQEFVAQRSRIGDG